MPRPLSFDPDKVLTKTMFYFWRKGYRGTSINDLIAHLGVNKFSLYQQFGNKEALYAKALAHYQIRVYEPLIEPLKAQQGLRSISAYLERLEAGLSRSESDLGCLINTTIVDAHAIPKECVDLATLATKELRYQLKRNFQIAEESGEIKSPHQSCVNFTLMTIQALIQTRKTLGVLVMRQNLRFFMDQIEQW